MSTTASTSVYATSSRSSADLWLHRFAVVVAVCTFCLILAGSMVTTTGSGLAVPDWPTTYGQNMFTYPPSRWVGGILYEHVHRLIGASVGVLMIVLCLWLWFSCRPRRLKWLGSAALLAVCLQGLLGGLTVIFRLPTWISVAHAGLAEICFCIALSIAVLTAPGWRAIAAGELTIEQAKLRRFCKVVLACVFLQIILGALMRHTQSGLAITDFPLAYGSLIPPTSSAALESINIERVWELELEPVNLAQVWIHFAHRVGALVVVLAAVILVRRVFAHFSGRKELVAAAMVLSGLLILQILLGAVTIWSQASLHVTTAHVGVGVLMLGSSLVLLLRTWTHPRR